MGNKNKSLMRCNCNIGWMAYLMAKHLGSRVTYTVSKGLGSKAAQFIGILFIATEQTLTNLKVGWQSPCQYQFYSTCMLSMAKYANYSKDLGALPRFLARIMMCGLMAEEKNRRPVQPVIARNVGHEQTHG